MHKCTNARMQGCRNARMPRMCPRPQETDSGKGAAFVIVIHMQPVALADPWVEKVSRACAYLTNGEGHVSLAALARRLGGSPYHLQRNFKRIVGVSPREYTDASRLQTMKRRLSEGADVTSAVLEAGYGSSSRFYERAGRQLGMTPSKYRSG